MTAEYNALLTNNTCSLYPRPRHKHVVRNKWVFKIKQRSDGSIDRYKTWLVAKGFDQVDGIDFTETFSPIIKPATIRLALALAVHYNWSIRQFDISNAFLHGYLEEEVYMEQPQGFEDLKFPDHVWLLHKSIYGFKLAPRTWFLRLSQALMELRFTASTVDTSLFTFYHSTVCIFVLIHVDDIIVTSNTDTAINTLISNLGSEFAIKDLRGTILFFRHSGN